MSVQQTTGTMGFELSCTCYPGEKDGHAFAHWIAFFFRKCYYTPTEVTSFVLGLMNIGCWLVAQVPQVVLNFMARDGGALSLGFMFLWLLGDITNLVGCIYTHQLPTQLYTAIYFCAMDVVMLGQIFGFAACRKYRVCGLEPLPAPEPALVHVPSPGIPDSEEPLLAGRKSPALYHSTDAGAAHSVSINDDGDDDAPSSTNRSMKFFSTGALVLGGAALLSLCTFPGVRALQVRPAAPAGGQGGQVWAAGARSSSDGSSSSSGLPSCEVDPVLKLHERIIGDVSAWLCFVCYFFGRVPQIVLNYQRKATEGLSFTMFFFALLGNLFYGTSIVIMPMDPHSSFFWESTLPYILGSYGCVLPSVVVLWQFFHYRKGARAHASIQ